jgi:hypothetical protein
LVVGIAVFEAKARRLHRWEFVECGEPGEVSPRIRSNDVRHPGVYSSGSPIALPGVVERQRTGAIGLAVASKGVFSFTVRGEFPHPANEVVG